MDAGTRKYEMQNLELLGDENSNRRERLLIRPPFFVDDRVIVDLPSRLGLRACFVHADM